ncbi:cytidylyltransferase domain-containing protein [Candidatus Omnitrophota bacterium]
MDKKEILAIIPARGGSKGIPGKNLKNLCDKPLIQYTIDAAKASKALSRVILSSDDKAIIAYCKDQGIEVPFQRPNEYAQDDSVMIDVIKHAVTFLKEKEDYQPGYVVVLQPTSPLRRSPHIDEAIEQLVKSDADSIVSVVEVPHGFSPYSAMRLEGEYVKPFKDFDDRATLRQNKPKFFARNGPAVLALLCRTLQDKNSLYGEKILPYLMSKEDSIDIDDEFDLRVAESLLGKK